MRFAVVVALLVACGESKPDTPTGPVTFKRDYTKPGTWRYAYRQEMSMTLVQAQSHTRTLESVGTIALVSNKNKTATLDIDAKLTVKDGGQAIDEPQQAPRQTMIISEDGKADDKDQTAMPVTTMLFPIPTKPMNVGDTVKVMIAIPERALPGKPAAPGEMNLVLTGFSAIKGIPCAQLAGTALVDDKTPEQTFHFTVDGKYCLDLDDAAVRTANVHIDMTVAKGTEQVKLSGTSTLARQ